MNCIKKLYVFDLLKAAQTFKLSRTWTSNINSNWARNQSSYASNPTENYNTAEDSEKDKIITKDILSKVNSQIKEKTHSRLFAIIQLGARKFKITAEDIISLNSFFPANVGDRLRLEKVLVIGSTDFTLLGRPLLSKDLVRIEATVIEKTYIIPRPLYRHGLHYRRLHWFRTPYVLFRINTIDFTNTLDSLPAVENVQNRVIY